MPVQPSSRQVSAGKDRRRGGVLRAIGPKGQNWVLWRSPGPKYGVKKRPFFGTRFSQNPMRNPRLRSTSRGPKVL